MKIPVQSAPVYRYSPGAATRNGMRGVHPSALVCFDSSQSYTGEVDTNNPEDCCKLTSDNNAYYKRQPSTIAEQLMGYDSPILPVGCLKRAIK